MSQTKPSKPVMIKAHCQPQFSTIYGMVKGVMIAPILAPELNMPVAKALSFLGNHSATVLIAAGKLPDSVTPNAPLTTWKPRTEFTREIGRASCRERV